MVKNPVEWTAFQAALIFLGGFISIWINYDADRQRALARATDGQCTIWGEKAKVLRVKYVTENGDVKHSLLLASGWWSVARHFHYIPELTASFFWALPAGFSAFMPYFYVTFLTFLLLDRGM
jgi:7-dehydrocholesterol reductase